jgi:hypothetical protein
MSVSSCSRRYPVAASIAQPPTTHHGRSNPASSSAVSRGRSDSEGPYSE